MKVCHLSVLRGFAGLGEQLSNEQAAAKLLSGVDWDVKAFFAVSDTSANCVTRLPWGFRGLLSRKLFAWLWLLKHGRKYDWVLMRYDPSDPFGPVFAPFLKHRVSVHHAKEVEAMPAIRAGWRGSLAGLIERLCGHRTIRHADGIIAVTDEIRRYQLNRVASYTDLPSSVYPNGVVLDSLPLLDDHRPTDAWVLGFMATQFQPWHGLDQLLDALSDWLAEPSGQSNRKQVILHLMGELLPPEIAAIKQLRTMAGDQLLIHVHGHTGPVQCREIFAHCHVGLGSFALERQGLTEASTLKVREMLAYGVPIYSGHPDSALPDSFPYYVCGAVNIDSILHFAQAHVTATREAIRSEAAPLIDKRACISGVVDFLKSLPR